MKYLIDGQIYSPIKIGDPKDHYFGIKNCTCGDCGGHYGEKHTQGCDLEVCPKCGMQFISCDCGIPYEVDENISQEKLNILKKNQIIDNVAFDLEIKTKLTRSMKYDDSKIFQVLAMLKMVMTNYGDEKDFDSIYEKVISADNLLEGLKIVSAYATEQRRKELDASKKNQSEM